MEMNEDRMPSTLAGFYSANGYVRRQNLERLGSEGSRLYKKGEEVRLVARSKEELRIVRRLLRKAGFKPGRPFQKGNQYRQPIYGRGEVARFIELVENEGRAEQPAAAEPRRRRPSSESSKA